MDLGNFNFDSILYFSFLSPFYSPKIMYIAKDVFTLYRFCDDRIRMFDLFSSSYYSIVLIIKNDAVDETA